MMKKVFLLVALLLIIAAGCTNMYPQVPEISPEQKAADIAQEYVMSTEAYVNYEGQGLTVKQVVQGACEGCWTVNAEFEMKSMNNPDITEKIMARVVLDNWEVSDFNTIIEEPEMLPEEQPEDNNTQTQNETVSAGNSTVTKYTPTECKSLGGTPKPKGGCNEVNDTGIGIVIMDGDMGACCVPI